MSQQRAFFLTVDGRALSATCFVPDTVRGAVLCVPPLVEERKGALPAFVQTARALASRGIAVLLTDLRGCGDSDGAFEEQEPEGFERDCDAAWAWLTAQFPNVPRAALGLRCGALLALRLAARHPDMAACLLWAPVSGSDFIRQLLQRRMVNDMVAYGKAREGRADLEARLRAGGRVDLDGYSVTGALYTWLCALTPQPCPVPLCVSAGGHDLRTAEACVAARADATSLDARYPPFWNTVGHVDLSALVTASVDWLDERLKGPSVAAPTLTVSSQTVTAELMTLPTADGAVQAILDRPTDTPRAGALFLHGWSGDRTGPHRLFTDFARQLTTRGHLCLRPDFIGRGLSDGAASQASIAGMAETARAALAELRARLPTGAPVRVVAICSGCKVAITLAADAPDIDRLVLWSAESMGDLRSAATGIRKAGAMLLTYAKKLTRPETWRKLLSGKVQTGMVAKALVKQETRSAAEAAWENGVLARFRAFRRPILFVFGGSDPDAPGSRAAYERYCRQHGIPYQTHLIAQAGHSYYGEAWTRELFEQTLAWLS
ncbi:MAG TPA: alpha/beta hydrolase [Kiritimatiellia bacterium]|nr:alpha/beta hydrolase [Kiritimatiellia bacterium]HRU69905.1 alpha/beta hydrolase [Kiritimatiellia bacterium]